MHRARRLASAVPRARRSCRRLLFIGRLHQRLFQLAKVLRALGIILGWKTRVVAFLLAGFSLLTAVTFHNNFADQTQLIMFFKNLSIAGGLLLLVVNGAGRFSLDARAARKSVA
jgi:uncharacterized membrane protein YphA (DoxX/SURF4 family)